MKIIFVFQLHAFYFYCVFDIYGAFNYTNRRGYFSLVYRPRPDSIQVQTITIPVEAKQNYGFLVGSFGLGLVLGVVSGAKR